MFKGIINREAKSKRTHTNLNFLFIILLLLLLSNPVLAFEFSNPGFESQGAYWAGSSVSGSSAYSHSGSYVMSQTINAATAWNKTLYQTVNLTGVKSIDFYYYSQNYPASAPLKVYVDSTLISTIYASEAGYTTPPPAVHWLFKSLPISVYSGNHVVKVESVGIGGSQVFQSFILDDFHLNYTDMGLPAPVASFNSSSVTGGVPFEVTFNDSSTNSPTSWLWFTDDLNGGTDRNLSHIYYSPGLFDVNLKASSPTGSDWENKTGFINVSSDKIIWYNLGNQGLYLNANIINYLASHEDNGDYIYYYVWENTSLGNYKHSSDLVFEDGILHPFTSFTPYYATANTATSSLYIIYLKNGAYNDVLAGSATWGNNYYNNDTLNSSDIPIIVPDVPPVPPVEPPIPNPDPAPAPTPGPDPAPPNPTPSPGPEPPLPPAPSNGSGNGSGDFPLEQSGNATLNYSGLGGYYTYVDSVFEPIHASVMGFLAFVVSPVTALSSYVSSLGVYLQEYSVGVGNTSFIASVVRPVFLAVPSPVYGLICLSLLFTILAYVFRYR